MRHIPLFLLLISFSNFVRETEERKAFVHSPAGLPQTLHWLRRSTNPWTVTRDCDPLESPGRERDGRPLECDKRWLINVKGPGRGVAGWSVMED